LFLDDDIIRKSIKSPNLTKRYSTLHNSTKNYFNKIDNYKMLKSLGKGSYGEVKLAVEKITGIKYAIKIYSKKVFDDPKKKRNIENEIKILKQLDNINIMKLHEVIKTDRFNYLIMEYIDGISLLEIIKKEKKHYLEEKRALKIFMQIVKAIEYCQSKNICHRDIKLENILTLKNDIIKLIDFGFAVKTNKETFQTLLCGSPSYMAPEIVKKEKYIAQYSDIWSLGVLLYSMLFGRFPFKGKTQEELFENIKKCEFEFPEEIEVSDEIKLLFKKIFVDIPAQRPSLNEILNDINLIGD
jgi:MAP/microtubule affinity-regulating kinase